jgi:Icc-related predicted phosphoesterase
LIGRKKRRSGRRLRIVFATDLHGADLVFRKFLNAVGIYEADIAILGGDLTAKRLVPIIVMEDGSLAPEQEPDVLAHASTGSVDSVLTEFRDRGRYPVAVTAAQYERLATTGSDVEDLFAQACKAQVERWLSLAQERLSPRGIPFYVAGGNDDYDFIEPVLTDDPYAINGEGQVLEIAPGIEMISTGYGNPTPWNCPRDVSEEELGEIIGAMASQVADPSRAIFNLHVPPFGSGLDSCPRLDTSVSPPRAVPGELMSAGSTAVRAAIEGYAPLLSLHGHIHESAAVTKLGRTTCVNPGSEYEEGLLRSAVVDVFDGGDSVTVQLLQA